jgi:hypothetical protein
MAIIMDRLKKGRFNIETAFFILLKSNREQLIKAFRLTSPEDFLLKSHQMPM